MILKIYYKKKKKKKKNQTSSKRKDFDRSINNENNSCPSYSYAYIHLSILRRSIFIKLQEFTFPKIVFLSTYRKYISKRLDRNTPIITNRDANIKYSRRYLAVEFTRFYKCPMTPPPTLVTRLCNSYSRPEPLIHPCHDHELLKQTAATERTQYILGTRMKPQCWPNSGATLREEGCTRKSPTIPAAGESIVRLIVNS